MDLLMTEKQILSKVNNDFVVHGAYSFNGPNHFFLAMEYMPGGDLAGLLQKECRFDCDQAKFYLAEIVQALQYLRNIDCVHRDLKPDNILLDKDGHLKLTDFGLSRDGMEDKKDRLNKSISYQQKSQNSNNSNKSNKLLQKPVSQLRTSNIGSRSRNNLKTAQSIKKSVNIGVQKRILGTPNYMCPQVINGDEHSFPVDYWSLGVICYEMVVGAFPFFGDTVEQLFKDIKQGEIQYPDIDDQDWTQEIDDFTKKLLDRNPKTRLGSTSIDQIKNHRFFKGINWDKLREMKSPINIIVKDPKDFVNLDEDRKISDKSWNALIRLTQPSSKNNNNNNNNNSNSNHNNNNNNLEVKRVGSVGGSNKKGGGQAPNTKMEIVEEQVKQKKKNYDVDFYQKNISYLEILNKQDARAKIAKFYKKKKSKNKDSSLTNELLPQTLLKFGLK